MQKFTLPLKAVMKPLLQTMNLMPHQADNKHQSTTLLLHNTLNL